jgi:hypothetical protein
VGYYAYCVVPRGQSVPAELTGIDGAAVVGAEVGELVLVVSGGTRPEPGVAHVEQHNAVIEAVASMEVTPVPLRFGQWAASLDALTGPVREQHAVYQQKLAEFSGALEFGVRVLRPDREQSAQVVRHAGRTGREYMAALAERVAAERAGQDEIARVRGGITEILGRFVRAEFVEEARTPRGIVTVSHLVARDQFEPYREHTQRLRQRFPELRFLVSGPWMPYSFAV